MHVVPALWEVQAGRSLWEWGWPDLQIGLGGWEGEGVRGRERGRRRELGVGGERERDPQAVRPEHQAFYLLNHFAIPRLIFFPLKTFIPCTIVVLQAHSIWWNPVFTKKGMNFPKSKSGILTHACGYSSWQLEFQASLMQRMIISINYQLNGI